MILAAGLGTRMRPLSALRAKPALPVLNRPLLHYTLEKLAALGIHDVAINTHHRPDSIRQAVRSARQPGLRIHYSHERRLLGSIGGVRKLRRFFGDEPALLLNGDMVFDFDLPRLIERHCRAGALASVSLQPFPEHGRYGSVVTDARGRIRSFGGYPGAAGGSAWHFTGVHVIEPRILERLAPGYAETARDLYGPLLEEGALLLGVPLPGAWYDLGSPPLYLASQMHLLDQGFAKAPDGSCLAASAHVGPGARIDRAVIGPRCTIGAGALVVDSVLWSGVRIGAGARVSRSILTDRVRIGDDESVRGEVVLPRSRSRLEP
jgi:mannose-1-phosphate guanylyltransferase